MKKITLILLFTVAFTLLITYTSESVFATISTDELVVSAVNPTTGNSFSGPQVVEVIVKNPDIQNTNQIQDEPSVTIGNIPLRMAQATDGYWYAFFADARFAQIADKTQYISSSIPSTGKGLDFGEFCSPATAINATGVDFSQTLGIATAQSAPGASNGYTSGSTSYVVTSTCTGPADGATKNISGGSVLNHVIRHPPSLNMMSGISGGKVGQIGINPNAWPVIQLISNPTPIVYANTAVVNLNTGSPTRQLLAEIDKASFPQQIAIELFDPSLKIDPTSIDSWTWSSDTSHNALYYQAFDESGHPDADGTIGMQNLSGNFTNLMLSIYNNANNIRTQPNGFQTLNPDGSTASIPALSLPVTMLETNSSSNFFINYDSSNKANVIQIKDPGSAYGTIRYSGGANQAVITSKEGSLTCCGYTMTPQFYHAPIASNNTYTVNEDFSNPIVLQGRTYDNYPITYSIVTNPQHGTLTNINHSNGSIIYLPNQDYVGNDVFSFKMSNKFYDSNIGTISLTGNSTNFTPSAKVGADQTVNAGSLVTLDGSGSIDPYYNAIMKYYTNGQTQPISSYLKYSWSQLSGIPVTLSNNTSSNPTFVAPTTTNGIILPFTLTVTDRGTSTSSPVTITVKPSSQIPPMQNSTTPSNNNTVSVPTPQPPSANIIVSTDKSTYNQGDAITIYSKISSFIPNQSITIRVLNEVQNPIYIASLPPAPDGSITTKLLATGPLWSTSGTYTVMAQYNSTIKTLTAFYFNVGNSIPPTNNITNTQSTTVSPPPTIKMTQPTSNITNTPSTTVPLPTIHSNTSTTQSNTSSATQVKPITKSSTKDNASSTIQSTSKNPTQSSETNENTNHQPQQNSSDIFRQLITTIISELKTLFGKIPG